MEEPSVADVVPLILFVEQVVCRRASFERSLSPLPWSCGSISVKYWKHDGNWLLYYLIRIASRKNTPHEVMDHNDLRPRPPESRPRAQLSAQCELQGGVSHLRDAFLVVHLHLAGSGYRDTVASNMYS
jgi:hypothetical protein